MKTTYQCEHCTFLTDNKKEMTRHEKECQEEQIEKAAALESRRIQSNYPRLNATSPEHYLELCNKIYERETGLELNARFDRINFYESCSNTHSAPIGKETNWHGDNGKPLGYKGFNGFIKFDCSYNIFTTTFGKNGERRIKLEGLYTGSGGSGKYDCTLWLDDFPKILESYNLIMPKVEIAKKNKKEIDIKYVDLMNSDALVNTMYNEIKSVEEIKKQMVDSFNARIKHLQEEYIAYRTLTYYSKRDIELKEQDIIIEEAKKLKFI